MLRYFFHLHDRDGTLLDPEGRLFDSAAAVRDYAVLTARSVMSSDVSSGVFDPHGWIEVVDERGATSLILQFEEAVLRVV